MKNWKQVKQKLLSNTEVKQEYKSLAVQFKVAAEVMALRQRQNLTQEGLAQLIGAKQSEISRIESGNRNLSIKLLERIAQATDSTLEINFSKGGLHDANRLTKGGRVASIS